MPRNGSGAYVAPAGQPVVSGTAISSTVFNALVTDLGNELTKSICTDGQTPMTANLPMGNNRITGMAAGVSAGDATRLDQVQTIAGAYLPLAGGTLTGTAIFAAAPLINNNIQFQIKDFGGTTRQLFNLATDNTLNWTVAGGTSWNIYNQAGSTVLWGMTNAGVVTMAGALTMNNATAINMKDFGGTSRPFASLAVDNNVYMNVSGGNFIRWYNQANTTEIMQLSNAGAFNAVSVTQTSDERYKENWQKPPADLIDQFASLKKFGAFEWKGKHKELGAGIGAGAQSLEAIWPALVETDEDGFKRVQYASGAMVGVIALSKRVVELEAIVAKLVQK